MEYILSDNNFKAILVIYFRLNDSDSQQLEQYVKGIILNYNKLNHFFPIKFSLTLNFVWNFAVSMRRTNWMQKKKKWKNKNFSSKLNAKRK